jgi:inhibitor of cysteine peptidase
MFKQHVVASIIVLGSLGIVLPIDAGATTCAPSMLGKATYGASGSTVRALQECLITLGYSIPAGVTGYYGAQTRTAVQLFYKNSLGLTWDGSSVGPQGRAKIVALAGSGSVSAVGGKGYKKVSSASELAKYVAERDTAQFFGGGIAMPLMARAESAQDSVSASAPSRVSETTVQVAGIDEPDIVKTDGQNLYISREGLYRGGIIPLADARMASSAMTPIWQDDSRTVVVDAFPLDELAVVSENIKEKGEMLLVKDKKILIILSYPDIVAYDVADPKKPSKKWTLTLEDNTSLVSARLSSGMLYFITQTWLTTGTPCPYIPLMRGATKLSIPCTSIWVPEQLEPVNNTYTVLAIDPLSGTEKQTVAFATDGETTTLALFKDNLYLATKSYRAPYEVLIPATITAYEPYVSVATQAKMKTISGYDISLSGKLNEIAQVAQADLAQKEENERLRIETEVQNLIQQQLDTQKRLLDRTRITRVPLANLSVGAVGEVPGSLLNQFALDEYQGNLRVAVTVGSSWWGAGETANDVYVLGADLKEKGKIIDLGLGERVYSVRFVGDTGYLVTFKQVDPFYVLDLRVPTAPKVAGELKIPGYSAYLEPLGDNLVLGVGREGSGVKLAVYDVSNPAKPVEKSKYLIKDSWTEVEGNHHAFLRDADHEIFFIPGSNGGYVLSYAHGKLVLKATVAGWSVKRAVYIDDLLYVIGDEKITVLDENSWKEVGTLKLNTYTGRELDPVPAN